MIKNLFLTNLCHATSISSHKDRSRNLRFLDLHADKGDPRLRGDDAK